MIQYKGVWSSNAGKLRDNNNYQSVMVYKLYKIETQLYFEKKTRIQVQRNNLLLSCSFL